MTHKFYYRKKESFIIIKRTWVVDSKVDGLRRAVAGNSDVPKTKPKSHPERKRRSYSSFLLP